MHNQPYMVRPTLIDLNPYELYYYSFFFSISRCNGSCNTIEDPFDRISISKKIEDSNEKLLNMIKRINVSKRLVKHISCQCK